MSVVRPTDTLTFVRYSEISAIIAVFVYLSMLRKQRLDSAYLNPEVPHGASPTYVIYVQREEE